MPLERRGRYLAIVCAVAASCAVAINPPARASVSEVTEGRLSGLAERARSDPEALERLRAVDRVDGRPVDVALVLGDSSGADLDARLRALADRGQSAPVSPARSKAQATAILSEDRFKPAPVPRPLRGLLETIGGGIEAAFRRLAAGVPGGEAVLWVIIALAVLCMATVVTGRTVRRRSGVRRAPPGGAPPGVGDEDPGRLDREADAAERDGHLDMALRLRFRAGLIRLHKRGAIRLRPSLATGEVARQLRSPVFDRLAADFDAVAYGGRSPERGQIEAARTGWGQLLDDRSER